MGQPNIIKQLDVYDYMYRSLAAHKEYVYAKISATLPPPLPASLSQSISQSSGCA